MLRHADIPLYGGSSLSRSEKEGEKSLLIDRLIPGEEAEVEIVEEKKNYDIAIVKEVKKVSEYRREAICPVYTECGGCSYQHIDDEHQVYLKEEILRDQFRRTAKMDIQPVLAPSLSGSPFEYRNRAQLKVDDEGRIGFYKASSHHLVPVSNCPLLAPSLNAVLSELSKVASLLTSLKEVHLFCNPTGDVALNLIRKNEAKKQGRGLAKKLRQLISLLHEDEHIIFVQVDKKAITTKGKPLFFTYHSQLKPVLYRSSPELFHQANTPLNNQLLEIVEEIVRKEKPKIFVDLYAGSGNISLAIASAVKAVIAIEESKYAKKFFLWNMNENKLKNLRFLLGKVEKTAIPPCDMLFLDPPRNGAGKNLCKKILGSGARFVLSLSCNPATHARDIYYLQEEYELIMLKLIDFFPQTKHIESFALLKRKS